MKLQTLRSVLQLKKLKSDQMALAAKQAKHRQDEAQSFADQVSHYAREYDQGLIQVALEGETAMLLQERAQFNAKLHSTALAQQEQVKPLTLKAAAAVQQALEHRSRAQAMERFVLARKQQMSQAELHREDKEGEDILQARLDRS